MTESKKKKETTMYLFHEISSYLPLLEDEEFDALVEDIRQFGQVEPAILYEGKIIDGRNRYRACKKLGIELEVREWKPSEATGMTPLQYVISTNIMRRHLNHAQRSEIGLLLLEEQEKITKKRIENRERYEDGTFKPIPLSEGDGKKGESADIVAKKVKVGGITISRAKKIKQIAEGYKDDEGKEHPPEPLIAEEWEKAKKEEIGIETVYHKAKAVEEVQNLPKKEREKIIDIIKDASTVAKAKEVREIAKLPTPQRKEILEELGKDKKPAKELIQEKKDEAKRLEIAKQSAELRKKHEEMELLLKRIKGHKNQIESFNMGVKNSEAKLKVLTDEITEKYPQWKGLEPADLLTKLSLYYDTLETEIYNTQLSELRDKYNKLMQPLREKLRVLEEEYDTQRSEIVAQKKERENDIKQLERYEASLNAFVDKIELNKSNISKIEKELEALLREYDEKYK